MRKIYKLIDDTNQELEIIILYDTVESLTPTPEELGDPADFFR